MKDDRALLKIPNLSIHLSSDKPGTFEWNKESHLRPAVSSLIYSQLNGTPAEEGSRRHYGALLDLISRELSIDSNSIVDLDMCLADTQPAQFLGLNEDFISSPRIDNLVSTFTAVESLIDASARIEDQSYVSVAAMFDHEEIGSNSVQGADSSFLGKVLERIFKVIQGEQTLPVDCYQRAIGKSFLISADMAHAVHPNYREKHQMNHRPKMNSGVVLKVNVNNRYTTDGVSASISRVIAEKAEVPFQDFCVKQDSPCGSTIGPMISAITGIKSCDIGAPQWAMHSIRETCGVLDCYYYFKFMSTFYKEYERINLEELLKF